MIEVLSHYKKLISRSGRIMFLNSYFANYSLNSVFILRKNDTTTDEVQF